MQTPDHIRLRNSVHVAPVDGGLYFVGWQETLMISGPPSLAVLWNKLFPHLHRGISRSALIEALPPKARDTATRLLDELHTNGFLRNEAPGERADHDVSKHPSHDRTLAFLDSAAAEPSSAFQLLRESPVSIVGEGPVAAAVVRCLLELGAGHLSTTDAAIVQEWSDRAADVGAVLANTSENDGTEQKTSVRVEIDATAPTMPDSTMTIGVAQLTDRAVVTPPGSGPDAPGIEVTVNRMRERHANLEKGPVTPALARMVGNLAALQVFYHLTGVSTEYDGKAYVVEAERLHTSIHPVFAPSAPGAVPVDAERFYHCEPDRISELTDSVTGVLPEVSPLGLSQMPLALATAGSRSDGGDISFGWGVTGDVARYRAVLDVARRSLLLPPTPGLWSLDETATRQPRFVSTCAGVDTDGMLADGAVRLIATWLDDPSEREKRFRSVNRETFASRSYQGTEWKQALIQELGVAADITVTVETFQAGEADVFIVETTIDGRRVGLWVHPDPDSAWHGAVRHSTAVLQAGGVRSAIPILATPPGAPQAAEMSTWTVSDVLEPLCRTGETIVAGRSTHEPALEILGTVGWLGIATEGGTK